MPDIPSDIVRRFLAQSGTLLDRLDGDLAELEHSPHGAAAADRLSGALSAIRTGAGALELTDFEHAAARASEALVALRHAGDAESASGLRALAAAVHAMGRQRASIEQTLSAQNSEPIPAPSPNQPAIAPTVERRTLRLAGSKAGLVEFMVEDLRDAVALAERGAEGMESPAGLVAGAGELARVGADLSRTARFFEFDALGSLADALSDLGGGAPGMSTTALAQAMPRVRAVLELVRELADALAHSTIIVRPVAGVCDALRTLSSGGSLAPARHLPSDCTPLRALEIDGVIAPRSATAQARPLAVEPSPPPAGARVRTDIPPVSVPMIDEHAARNAAAVETSTILASTKAPSGAPGTNRPASRSIANSLDEALIEVGNLVVQANRLASMAYQSCVDENNAGVLARLGALSDEVASASSGIRNAVRNARSLPIAVLFARCLDAASPARDRVDIAGADLDADTGVIDRLTAPLTALVAACAGSSLARLTARHDDAPDVLELAIGASGAPDTLHAAVASARAPIESMHGAVAVERDDSGRTTIRVRVPANPVFLRCALVRVGGTHVAFPIDRVREVIRPEPDQRIGGTSMPVVMVRGGAAALLDGASLFGDGRDAGEIHPYAVVVEQAGKRVAVSCSRPVAAQEIIVRPMDPMPAGPGPIAGVGAMLDGSPALIADIPALVRLAGEKSEAGRIAA